MLALRVLGLAWHMSAMCQCLIFASPALEEVWSDDAALLELDRILPEGAEMSSVEDISSHVCESFFMSPESTLECEQPIKRVYQSLSVAVDGLLEMALDSSRQVSWREMSRMDRWLQDMA